MASTVYSVAQVAEIIGCSKGHVYNMLKRGELRYFRFGEKLIRIPIEAVDELMTLAPKPPAQDTASEKKRREAANLTVRLARMTAKPPENR